MNVEAPAIARRLFARLSRGDNHLLSRNGPGEDADLFKRLEGGDEDPCRNFFELLGFRLQKSDNCYYLTVDEEPQANQEAKLEQMVRLVRMLDFLSTHVEGFAEGQVFSGPALVARCNNDPKAEHFLMFVSPKAQTNADRLESLLQWLVRRGYLSEFDASRQEYRVLSAINYIQEFLDRIEIPDESAEPEESNGQA
jgi:hypothetical protein